ncbi:hypothetical protein B0H34DRAFT_862103 [Crassisporium funariophilum]|nr:hypothetical protein B0H34DRAFT_862103 [Crassisporium funariophilum]
MSATSSAYTIDLEAQHTISGPSIAPLSSPVPVLTHQARTPPAVRALDPMDDFFGYTFSSSRTHESRHDQSIADVPPPYVEESILPAYSPYAEPITLAMYLFKFGFLFPPFWIFGAFILLSPLREPQSTSDSVPAWMPEKTEAERQQIIAEMRQVELKWAHRSLYALIILIVLALGTGVAAWALLRR